MASTWPPKKATAFTLDFNLFDKSGNPLNASAVTRLVAKNGGAYASMTNAVAKLNATYGFYSVVLTATEMNADRVACFLCGTAATAVPYTMTLYTAGQTLDEVSAQIGVVAASLAHLHSDEANTRANTQTLVLRLTSQRAGYLDNLSGMTVSNITASVWQAARRTLTDKSGFSLTSAYDAAKSGAPTPAQINAYLAASHGAGAWGLSVESWSLVDQDTLDTSNVPLGPVTVNSDPVAGAVVTAYHIADTNRSTPIASDVTDGNGHFSFQVDTGTYIVVCAYSGVTFPERTVTVA